MTGDSTTPYHARYFAHELTLQRPSADVDRLSASLFNATVDLNPHQIDAALFALKSPLSKGVLLADEVGLGKTIEAGLVLCQLWAERRRRLLVICPASIRKQWSLELEEKFNLPTTILDAPAYRKTQRAGNPAPFLAERIVITSINFASAMQGDVRAVAWDLVVIDEAHKLRNAYRPSNQMGQRLRWALEDRRKLLLTATPLQNSLLELFGLSTIIDDHLFGDVSSFRSQYMRQDSDLAELRARLADFTKRTLRNQVAEYIQYTERRPITRPFHPTDDEHKLYETVSEFLLRDDTFSIPVQQRSLTTLILRKLLASSSHAIAGTLETMKERLEKIRDGLPAEESIAEALINAEELEADYLDEMLDLPDNPDAPPPTDAPAEKPKPDPAKLQAEITELDGYIAWARGIGIDTKSRSLLNALEIGFAEMQKMGANQKALIFTESRRTQDYLRSFLAANGYPISSFLFWRPSSAAAKHWTSYKFLEEIRDGGSHNTVANLNGVTHPVFVLDGQQRLTALNIGLRGIYSAKDKGKHWNNPDAFKAKRLYIDLVRRNVGGEADGEEVETRFRFSFLEKPPAPTKKSCWFEVGSILNCRHRYKLDLQIRRAIRSLPRSASQNARESVKQTLRSLHESVFTTPTIFYHTETLPDYDRVLDIFVRANEAGTKLTKSDLLLSTLIANWEHEDARKEIHNFVDHLNENLCRRNDVDKDFVIKACFVLCDLPVKYKITTFTRANLKMVERCWPAVKSALERCLNLANRFGIDRENLSSANALIPVAYYLYKNPGETLLGGSRWESRNADAIRRWLTMALLNGVFSGSSDTMLSALREVLRSSGRGEWNFPVDRLNKTIAQRGRSAEFDQKALEKVLALEYGDPNTFLALTLLYDESAWGNINHHQDHIFPRHDFSYAGLKRAGVPKADIDQFIEQRDRIANLQLLTERENTQKRAQEFKTWIRTRHSSFRRKHLIPKSRRLYPLKRFENFLAYRERLIRSRLTQLFG